MSVREVDPTTKGWKFVIRDHPSGRGIWERPDGTLYVFAPGQREVLTELTEEPGLRLVKS